MQLVSLDGFFENFPCPCAIITVASETLMIRQVNKALADYISTPAHEIEGKPISFLAAIYGEKISAAAGAYMTQSLQQLFFPDQLWSSAIPRDSADYGMRNTAVRGQDGALNYVIHQVQFGLNAHTLDGHSAADKYHAVFNYCSVPMWIYDMKTLCFLDVNEAAIRHYGYSRSEFMSMTIKDIRPPEDIVAMTKEVERLLREDKLFACNNTRHLKKDGTMIQVRIESNEVYIDGHKARVVSAFDITEDARLREEIVASSNRLSAAQAMANLGHWIYELEAEMLYWSDEMYRIFDTNPQIFTPTVEVLKGFVHKDDWPDESFEQQLAANDHVSFESRVTTARKKEKALYHTLHLIRDEQLQPVRVEGICMDITQRKLDEAALKRKNDLLEAVNKFASLLLGKGKFIEVIKRAFAVIGATVDVDRIYFYENSAYENGVSLVNQRIEWNKGMEWPIMDNPGKQQLSLVVADVAAGLLPGGRFAAIVKNLPESTLKDFLQEQQAISVAALPIFVNDKFYGFIGFENLDRERFWEEDEFIFLEAVTGHLATALERNNTTKALKDSQEQFESVINNLPGITYRCKSDEDATMLFLSEEVKRMTGYDAADFIDNKTLSFVSIIHPDDRCGIFEIGRQVDKRKPFELEYRLITRDGRVIWVTDIGRGVFDDNGQLLYVDGVILDVTAHRQQEQLLRESNERFRLVMKASREAIIDWDIQSDVTIWGDGFREIFNYDEEACKNNHLWSDNIHPEDKPRVLKAVDDILADPLQDTLSISFRFLKAGGAIAYVHHRGMFIRNAAGVAVRAIGSMSDVTDIMRHTRKIEQQNDILKEIAWMQSHVVRAPAAKLQGLLELLRDEIPPGTEAATTLGFIEDAAKELDTIITDIIIKSEQVNSKTSNGNLP